MTPPVVLDANILLRLVDPGSSQHAVAVGAARHLAGTGSSLVSLPQSIYEFWVVATRPLPRNGLGLSVPQCDALVQQLLVRFPVLGDPAGLFAEWRTLVVHHRCQGKVAHDARYVAAMHTHGVTHLLTFNTADFQRYPNLIVLDPHTIQPPTPAVGGTP